MSEFKPITIFLTEEQIVAARAGELSKAVMRDLIIEVLPTLIEVDAGMCYTYPDGNSYEVVRVGETQAVVRRRKSNRSGPIGSVFTEHLNKIRADLREGEAVLVEDIET